MLVRGRDEALETLRGIAALCVMAWHIMLAFFPRRSGIFPNDFPQEDAFSGNILFAFFNATAAVTFFFVLSGFVLTRRYFVTGDSGALLSTALRRWPRLAGPVLAVVLLSWILFSLNAYVFAPAAEVTKSPWLLKFGYAYDTPFQISFVDALLQGSVFTFFRGDFYYDSSLWTMRYEFIGSFIAFGLAALIGARSTYWMRVYLLLVVILLARIAGQHWYAGFLAGVALAATLPAEPVRLPLPLSLGGVAIAFYLSGYSGVDRGAFHPLFVILRAPPSANYMSIAAALILIACILTNERVHAIFTTRLGLFLGWISFPLYLLHVPVICSAGAAGFLATFSNSPEASPWVGALVTAVVSIAGAVPLAYANDRWRDLLREIIRPAAPAPGQPAS